MEQLKKERHNVRINGTVGAILAMGAFLCTLLFDPNNALWLIPIVSGYFASNMAISTVQKLNNRIAKAYGHDDEEHF